MPHNPEGPSSALRLIREAPSSDALAAPTGERVGLSGLLGDLSHHGRRGLAPGLRVKHAVTWDREDRRTTQWWPQGISTSADASDDERVLGRRLAAVSWYAKPVGGEPSQGTRISFVDVESRRYEHVLLLTPDGRPLRIHAGGLVWWGPYLHVAATAKGFWTCHVDDIIRVADPSTTYGYRYVLPMRLQHAGKADEGTEPLRYSCMSLDRSTSPPQLLVAEYGRGRKTTRLARFALDEQTQLPLTDAEGVARPSWVDDRGRRGTQGLAAIGDRTYLTVSHGSGGFGSLYVGVPGDFRHHRFATPMGPEDLSAWPSRRELWTVTEHPHRRWVVALRTPYRAEANQGHRSAVE